MVKFKRGRGCLGRLEVLCSVYSIKGAGYGRFMVWSVVGEGRGWMGFPCFGEDEDFGGFRLEG